MRPIFAVILTCLITWAGPNQATAQVAANRTLSPPRVAAVDQAVRKVMEEDKLVGVAIGVIRDGKVVYVQGYGDAVEGVNPVPMTEKTVINWASNSKPMAAILAMQLVEKKMLDLDVDVRRYVPEFPDKGVTITSRQILCHQSGIPHYANGKIVPSRRANKPQRNLINPILSLDRFSESPLIFEPGARADYSSYAYILLSAVIERAGKQPYDEQVKTRIAGPLKLETLQLDHQSPGTNWSTGYVKRGNQVVPAPEDANDWKFGAGGYKSDVRDFAAWATAILDHKLVSETTERLMWTPQKTRGGEATQFGLGLAIDGKGTQLRVSHNGSQAETATRMVLFPRANHGVVVMSNSNYADVGKITTAINSAMR